MNEESDEDNESQEDTESKIPPLISKIFFVVCTLFQFSSVEHRVLAHRTIAALPRKQFVESGLGILLGETLLRESMDQNLLISSLGIKGLFWYTNTPDLWEGYLMKWLTHPSNVIRESCLVGLVDVLMRFHYGWDLDTTAKVPHDNEQTSELLWTSISHIAPIVENIISSSEEERETNLEIEILRDRGIQFMQLCPLLRCC